MPITTEDAEWIELTVSKVLHSYEKSSWWNAWAGRWAQVFIIVCSLMSAVVAAALPDNPSKFKWLVVAISALGAATATLINTMRFHEMHEIRSQGRQTLSNLESRARNFFLSQHTPAETAAFREEITQKVFDVENDQGALVRRLGQPAATR